MPPTDVEIARKIPMDFNLDIVPSENLKTFLRSQKKKKIEYLSNIKYTTIKKKMEVENFELSLNL